MATYKSTGTFSNGWLAFELGVLRRLKFSSIAIPLTGEPQLGVQLKRWGVRLAANDPLLWAFTKATALLENSSERLGDEDFEYRLNDAYAPRDKMTMRHSTNGS